MQFLHDFHLVAGTGPDDQRDHADRDETILGWIGSYPNVRYLEERLPELSRAAAASGRRVRLIAVGAAGLPEAEGLSVEASEWTAERELDALSRIDVGLMPLPDNPWTRGKCAYKGILYMAAGIPVVADDVGVSAEAIGDRKGGLIVRDREEWVQAVEALIGDTALRGRLGAEARRRADEQFSVAHWAPTLASLIRG